MSHGIPDQPEPADTAPLVGAHCPAWCVSPHGMHDGEEDWLHSSEPRPVPGRGLARLCMTVDPTTSLVDGPYVLVGADEYTPAEAREISLTLEALAVAAEDTSLHASA